MECKVDGCEEEAYFARLCQRHLHEHRKPINFGLRVQSSKTLSVLIRSSIIIDSIGERTYEHVFDEILRDVEKVVARYIQQEIAARNLVNRGLVDADGPTWEVSMW